jgi:Uma2 family endonuclease
MSATASLLEKPKVVYPESDGLPMSDNTKQFHCIVTIQGGLDAVFRNDAEVFVGGNLLWYPVEGNNTIRIAPDILVAFGRPKGHRGSYLQWQEGNIAPQVVWEIVSPGNRAGQLTSKFSSYDRYGVEEYYLYDPDSGDLNGWIRKDGRLRELPSMNGWISPRLKVRFALVDGELHLYGPDGQRFATYVELVEQREQARAEMEKVVAEKEKERAEKEKALQRAEHLAAQLKALGVESPE